MVGGAIQRPLFVCLCLCLSGWAGCQSRLPAGKADTEAVEQLVNLPGLRASHDEALKDEWARIVAQHATPKLLAEQEVKLTAPNGQAYPTAIELADRLDKVLSRKRVELILGRLEKLYPKGPFQFDPIRLQQAIELRTRFRDILKQYDQAVGQLGFQFRVNWEYGLLADLSAIDHARLIHRLEAIGAAESLANGSPSEAMLPVRKMLRIDQQLAHVKHVVPRLAAARLRAESLHVLQAIVSHPRSTRTLQAELLKIINRQLAEWPADADAWVGDRAVGLHTYELVRSGQLLSILTQQEIRELKKDGQLRAFLAAVTKSIDNDQRVYLDVMRQVIASCEEPFYRRKTTLDGISRQLEQLRDTPRYPLFAAKVLLADLPSGLQLQTLDQARCVAWSRALATALDRPLPSSAVNPLTGQPYAVVQTDEEVRLRAIDGIEGRECIDVPRRRRSASRPRNSQAR